MFCCRFLRRAKPSVSGREIHGVSYSSSDRVHRLQTLFPPVLLHFRFVAPWFPTSAKALLLQFPSPSWIADDEFRISPNSSPIKSRKTSAINHSASSFRFCWEDEIGRSGVKSGCNLVNVYISNHRLVLHFQSGWLKWGWNSRAVL